MWKAVAALHACGLRRRCRRTVLTGVSPNGCCTWAATCGLAGDPRTIQDPSELPAGDFRVESINLIGAHSLDPPDLAKLSALAASERTAPSGTDRRAGIPRAARTSTAAM